MSGQMTLQDNKATTHDIQVHIDAIKVGVQEIAYHLWELKQDDKWREYHVKYDTWEEFCRAHFQFTGVHAGRLLTHYEVTQSLPADLRPKRESHSRVLVQYPAEVRAQIMEEAKSTAPPNPHIPGARQLSAAHIQSVAERIVKKDNETEEAGEKPPTVTAARRTLSTRTTQRTPPQSEPQPTDRADSDIDELPRLIGMEREDHGAVLVLKLYFPIENQMRPFKVRNDGAF